MQHPGAHEVRAFGGHLHHSPCHEDSTAPGCVQHSECRAGMGYCVGCWPFAFVQCWEHFSSDVLCAFVTSMPTDNEHMRIAYEGFA